jgi:DNA-binding MarR family transcriptional regulator
MQATSQRADRASATDLAVDLGALVNFLLKAGTPEMFRALSELGLSLTQIKVLHMLEGGSERSLKEIAETFSMSLAAMSRSVDDLHQRGLVERREDEVDRRIRRVRIMPAGREIIQELAAARVSQFAQFLETLSAAERRRLAAAVAPLLERADIAACRPKGGCA